MAYVWHPLSTVRLVDPPCLATTSLARMMLRAAGRIEIAYAGDRMWPALRHGATIGIEPCDGEALAPGTVVLATWSGLPDVLRVVSDGDVVRLAADADPDTRVEVDRTDVIGRTTLPSRPARPSRGGLLRGLLDVHEAWTGRPDPAEDAAGTVRDKYDDQAPFYERSGAKKIETSLLDLVISRVPPGGRILVVGCGTGTESLELAERGYRVTGVDFSERMIESARRRADEAAIDVDYAVADVRRQNLDARSLDAVLFTYDVYSFIPNRRDRVQLLRKIQRWVGTRGVVFLSARRARTWWTRAILTLQWLALQRATAAELGDSHTRWIDGSGTLRRSFVHVFSTRELRDECETAGFRLGDHVGGHVPLGQPGRPAMIPGSRSDQ